MTQTENSSTWNICDVKNILVLVFISILCSSCKQYKTIEPIENYRVESSELEKDNYFAFESKMDVVDAKLFLRKKFLLSNDQNLKFFKTKLFDDLDTIFWVNISFEKTKENKSFYGPTIYCRNNSAPNKNKSVVLIKIMIKEINGENCLSTNSLFYDKTKALLINMKDNFKKEEYITLSATK